MLNWLKKNSFKIIIIVVVVIVIFLINLYLQMTKPVPKVKVQKENEITVNSLVAKVEDHEPFLSAFGRGCSCNGARSFRGYLSMSASAIHDPPLLSQPPKPKPFRV